jgi:hypothetical protein
MLIGVGNINFYLKITFINICDIVRFAHSSPEGLLVDADYFLRHGAKIIGIRESPFSDE